MSVSTALSANIEVGGRRVPLSSQPIDTLAKDLEDKAEAAVDSAQATAAEIEAAAKAKVEAIKAKVGAGITFGLAAGADISVSLADIVEWMSGVAKDFKLPPEVAEIFKSDSAIDDMSVTITAFSVNTAGAFNIALRFDFGPEGLATTLGLPEEVASWINVNDIGLAFSYKNKKVA